MDLYVRMLDLYMCTTNRDVKYIAVFIYEDSFDRIIKSIESPKTLPHVK